MCLTSPSARRERSSVQYPHMPSETLASVSEPSKRLAAFSMSRMRVSMSPRHTTSLKKPRYTLGSCRSAVSGNFSLSCARK